MMCCVFVHYLFVLHFLSFLVFSCLFFVAGQQLVRKELDSGIRTCGWSFDGSKIMITTDKNMGKDCFVYIFDAVRLKQEGSMSACLFLLCLLSLFVMHCSFMRAVAAVKHMRVIYIAPSIRIVLKINPFFCREGCQASCAASSDIKGDQSTLVFTIRVYFVIALPLSVSLMMHLP